MSPGFLRLTFECVEVSQPVLERTSIITSLTRISKLDMLGVGEQVIHSCAPENGYRAAPRISICFRSKLHECVLQWLVLQPVRAIKGLECAEAASICARGSTRS